MSGSWTFREADQHRCALPIYDKAKKYDRWKCFQCDKEWIVTKVNFDQKDGDWLSFEEYEGWKAGPFPIGTK